MVFLYLSDLLWFVFGLDAHWAAMIIILIVAFTCFLYGLVAMGSGGTIGVFPPLMEYGSSPSDSSGSGGGGRRTKKTTTTTTTETR